jgi:hypothetical protein
MSALANRKTRLIFETEDAVRERGAVRQVIVHATPRFALMRLKGLRRKFLVSYAAVYALAVRIEVEARRAEKRKERRAA